MSRVEPRRRQDKTSRRSMKESARRDEATRRDVDAYDASPGEPRLASTTLRRTAVATWIVAWIIGTALAATTLIDTEEWFDVGLSAFWARFGAAILCVVFVGALTHRCGARLRIWPPMAVVLALAALLAELQFLVTSATILTAIAGSVLAVFVTRPATRLASSIGEALVAILVAFNTTIAVAAWNATVHAEQFRLVVVMLSIALVMGVIWTLGANLHGLERKAVWILVGIAAGVVVVISYATVVRTYGSEGLVTSIEDVRNWFYLNLGGAPRPTIFAVGIPAIILGVTMRSRRREGWWVIAFGVVGTVAISTAIVNPDALPMSMLRSVGYSVVAGVVVGALLRYVLLRSEIGSRSSRAIEKRDRQEPGRTEPLQ